MAGVRCQLLEDRGQMTACDEPFDPEPFGREPFGRELRVERLSRIDWVELSSDGVVAFWSNDAIRTYS